MSIIIPIQRRNSHSNSHTTLFSVPDPVQYDPAKCPAWCTRDHEAEAREDAASAAEFGVTLGFQLHSGHVGVALADDLAGSEVHVSLTQVDDPESPTVYEEGPELHLATVYEGRSTAVAAFTLAHAEQLAGELTAAIAMARGQ